MSGTENPDTIDGEAHTVEWPPVEETGDGLDALPGLARIAASAGWRTSGWALRNSLRLSQRLATAATSPQEAVRFVRDAQRATESVLTEILNATETGQRVSGGAAPVAGAARKAMHDAVEAVAPVLTDRSADEPGDSAVNGGDPAAKSTKSAKGGRPGRGRTRDALPDLTLREQGELLMRRSRDVRYEADAHPAYARILSELAPDEGRILRLLLLHGPQPSVDVRTGGPLGIFSSRLIAPGISMIGARAGCRYVDRVPSYLNNLFRLGLVWFSRETIRDHMKYQVLEAQPEVLDAIHSVSQAKMVRRSIHLTPFGEDFCRTCLVTDLATATELPAHSAPPENRTTASPPAESA